jgi:hypothetical protein
MKDMSMKNIKLVGAKLLKRNVKYETMVDKLTSVTKMVTIGKPKKEGLQEVVAISDLELLLLQKGDVRLEDAKEKKTPITSTQAIDLEALEMKLDQSSQDVMDEQHANMQASYTNINMPKEDMETIKLTN